MAFIYPCWDIEPPVSGNPPNNPNPICNSDSTLSLTNPVYRQFGTNKSDLIRKLMIQNDTLYAIGYTYGNYAGNNADPDLLSGDVFVQKLDTDLNLLNGVQFGTPHEDRAYGYLKDANLWIGGMMEGFMAGNSFGSFDGFLAAVKTDDLTFYQPVIVSVDDAIPNAALNLYPNPVSNFVRMDLGVHRHQLVRIELFNTMGQKVKEVTARENEIDVSGLSDGVYYLIVELDNERIIKKLVKQ